MNDNSLLALKNLSISLKVDDRFVPVTEDVDLRIQPGRVLALVGESGCGKSVTASALLQLLPKELMIVNGEILFYPSNKKQPLDIARLSPKGKEIRRIRGNEIAMIFQEPMSSFSPLHTIGNQIGEVISLHNNITKADARVMVVNLLKKVGIGNPEKSVESYPHMFSGGMRQRAMIARALSCNPALLIADEPTTALDVTIQAQILNVMREMQREYGMAILFITHNLGVVAQMAHDVAIMYMGRIIEQGSVYEIMRTPRHPYTINLLRAVPRLGDLEAQKRLRPIKGSVPSLFERPQGCAFAPRCDQKIEGCCGNQIPPRRQLSQTHFVSCFWEGKSSKGDCIS